MKPNVLVIDDDLASCRLVAAIFEAEGFSVQSAHAGGEGLEHVVADRPDVALLDMGLPDMDGLAVLEALSDAAPGLPVLMLTADHDVKSAVRATRLGAYDYLTKPIDHDEVVAGVRRALETRALRREVEELRRQVGGGAGLAEQMGPSQHVREVIDQVATVAASRFTVLLLGETGTGKELVAQAIHRQSDRRSGPFVALDCGAIPETLMESELFGHEKGSFTGADRTRRGRFQLAEGGTLFLDEVGNLPQNLQSKLLRVLESQQVVSVGGAKAKPMDVRFIAATNDDLPARAGEGRFRADLYFRLAQYTLRLPTLRDRPSDIPHLAARFAAEASVELRRPVREIAPDAIQFLQRLPWRGNVRELRNAVRQAVLQSKDLILRKEAFRAVMGEASRAETTVSSMDLPGASLKQIATEAVERAEREAICRVLRATKGNKSQAARALQTDYKTLHLKMKSLGIGAKDFRP
jgi:DNA-binding NtrC family response regulator